MTSGAQLLGRFPDFGNRDRNSWSPIDVSLVPVAFPQLYELCASRRQDGAERRRAEENMKAFELGKNTGNRPAHAGRFGRCENRATAKWSCGMHAMSLNYRDLIIAKANSA